MKLLKRNTFLKSPWKNEKGITYQIQITPSTASLNELNFDWRLSMAEISGKNTFSQFKNYSRLLTVWKGQGITLNLRSLKQFEIYQFSGDDQIDCNLIKDPVTDLGLIFNPNKIRAQMKIIQATLITLTHEINLLFCAEGSFEVQNLKVETGDCLQLSPQTIELQGNATIIHTAINLIL